MNSYIVYGQDGEIANISIRTFFNLSIEDVKYDKHTKECYFDFVGFVFCKGKILAVFPKHYFTETELADANKSDAILEFDIRLLYDSIRKYSTETNSNAVAKSYLGRDENYKSDYPFEAFYAVYDYFRNYGLYKEQEEIIKPGVHGKISWKKTIQNADMLVNNGNIIFSPLFVKKNNYFGNFITECMAFIIDYTIEYFNMFITLPRTMYRRSRFNYLENIDYVIKKLYEIKGKVYKDNTKALISNMIRFFEEYERNCKGGSIHIRINYFELVWEKAVELYLNKHFNGVSALDGSISFDTQQKASTIKFEKAYFSIDDSPNQYGIAPDYFAVNGNEMYLFDAKYYSEVKGLNYKQYAYNEMLRYYTYITKMHSILLLPGQNSTRKHFELSNKYIGSRTYGNAIMEQYINVKDVLSSYVK